MTEDSERMMLLLKELAVLKQAEAKRDVDQPTGIPRSTVTRRRKEIAREMKRLAQSSKSKRSK